LGKTLYLYRTCKCQSAPVALLLHRFLFVTWGLGRCTLRAGIQGNIFMSITFSPSPSLPLLLPLPVTGLSSQAPIPSAPPSTSPADHIPRRTKTFRRLRLVGSPIGPQLPLALFLSCRRLLTTHHLTHSRIILSVLPTLFQLRALLVPVFPPTWHHLELFLLYWFIFLPLF
jgi:hypothetical protein